MTIHSNKLHEEVDFPTHYKLYQWSILQIQTKDSPLVKKLSLE